MAREIMYQFFIYHSRQNNRFAIPAFLCKNAVIVMVLLTIGTSCMRLRMTEEEIQQDFAGMQMKPTQHYYQACGRQMNYAEIGHDSLPAVIFVHGSPGSWAAFRYFFKDTFLLSRVKMISVDRPGFGYSDYGNAERSLQAQAACLKPVVEKYSKKRKVILVGHSLGGPLIARMAMDYSELIEGLIFIAPSVDPELESGIGYRKFANFLLFRWMHSTPVRVSNQEIIPLKHELEKMLPLWKNIKQKCIVIQGDCDDMVPAANAAFADRMLINASYKKIQIIENMNHFVPWLKPEIMREAIAEMLK